MSPRTFFRPRLLEDDFELAQKIQAAIEPLGTPKEVLPATLLLIALCARENGVSRADVLAIIERALIAFEVN